MTGDLLMCVSLVKLYFRLYQASEIQNSAVFHEAIDGPTSMVFKFLLYFQGWNIYV